MPRDSAGNYTLPAGNPVLSSTIIDTSWANPTMEDLGDSLTNSLSRNGEGGMLVPFKNVDGTVAAPGITFTTELGTGIYRFGAGDMRATVQGNPTVRFRNDTASPAGNQNPFQVWNGTAFANVITVAYTGQYLSSDGIVSAPTYTFANSPSTGLWSSGTNTLDWTIGGINKLKLNSAALTTSTPLELDNNVLPAASTVRDGAIAYNGVGGIAIKVGTAWANIPSSAPANNGNLIEVATPIAANGPVIEGVYNFIDTRAAAITLNLPAGVVGSRWGDIDFFRTFNSNNCILVADGTDLIENSTENYEMNLRGVSGVMRYTADRGWVDTGGMS